MEYFQLYYLEIQKYFSEGRTTTLYASSFIYLFF